MNIRTNKQIRLMVIIGIGFTLLITSYLILSTTTIRINEDTYNLIKSGMTQSAVEKIIGVPPGDYVTGKKSLVLFDLYGNGVFMKPGQFQQWGGDDGFIQIGFDDNDQVLWTRFVPNFGQ